MNTPETNRENSTPVTCPYCGQEMQAGSVTGDGRGRLYWQPAGARRRILDYLVGRGSIKSATYQSLLRFDLKGNYCPGCMKLIIDTEIQK
ncbi:MAG: PF20097 family protein [Succiniclasticum sp.]|nr:PF20097 family protein [Succiniclasticum sp.]